MSKLSIKFFSYKGHIGANSDIENGKFLNDPKAKGQLGVIALTENIGLPLDVKQLILDNIDRQGGSFANVMLTKSPSGKESIGILGFNCHTATNKNLKVEIGRTCNLEVLNSCVIIDNEPPEDYKRYIDRTFKDKE